MAWIAVAPLALASEIVANLASLQLGLVLSEPHLDVLRLDRTMREGQQGLDLLVAEPQGH